MSTSNAPTDEQLLASDDPEAFGRFYDRHVTPLLGYFVRRTGDPHVAADLTAETFASALAARRRFKPGGPPAAAWLYAIAARRLVDYQRRGRVDARMRRSLAMERRALTAEDAASIGLLADQTATVALDALPADQREAVVGRVVAGYDYGELAVAFETSEVAVRQRVSRGLAALRRRLAGGSR